jgi:hypothetical protein
MLAVLLLAASTAPVAEVRTIELYRGATLAHDSTRYWAVEDLHLDTRQPEDLTGGYHTLLGGPGRTILIRFGDLQRAVGARVRIRKAELELAIAGPGRPSIRSVAQVQVPWGEGPMRTLVSHTVDPKTVRWNANWRHRRAGESSLTWQMPGASGPADARPIGNARLEREGDEAIRIVGIEQAVQAMLDRPRENFGFALQFEEPTEFFSSQAGIGRPRLRLEMETLPAPKGPDLSVQLIRRERELTPGEGWPRDGEEITYVATIKNVGDAPSPGFAATWIVRERPGITSESPRPLGPGETTTLTLRQPFRVSHEDHRLQPIGLRLRPLGDDADPSNDALTIDEGALTVAFRTSNQRRLEFDRARAEGRSRGLEDWLQGQVALFNESFLAHSRYSFATQGALERVRVVSFGGPDVRADVEADVVVYVEPTPSYASDRKILRQLAIGMGLPDLGGMRVATTAVSIPGAGTFARRMDDLAPGLLGGGDTRFDGLIPGAIPLPNEPLPIPLLQTLPLESSDLLSKTEVGILNAALGLRGASRAKVLTNVPKAILLRVTDASDKPIAQTELQFFQSESGAIRAEAPTFTLVTDANGTAMLPRRTEEAPAGPFGVPQANGANGVLLVRTQVRGVEEWNWVKLWQVYDALYRGNEAIAFLDLRLNVAAGPLEANSNLARERIVTDSHNSMPAVLNALVDGDPGSRVTLGARTTDWVEIDLGRDRFIGEVRLVAPSEAFWDRFDILLYATGQRPENQRPWASEILWEYSFHNRRDLEPDGGASIAYRGPQVRSRYIRLVNRSGSEGPGSLGEIRVVGVRQDSTVGTPNFPPAQRK